MKVLLVNTFDRGGAAIACLRLQKGLLNKGIDAKALIRPRQKETTHTYTLKPKEHKVGIFQKIVRKIFAALGVFGLLEKKSILKKQFFLKNRDEGLEFFSFLDSSFDITSSKLYQEADIINLHWVADFLDYNFFFKKNTKPVVWTLHDMNPFSGGEHYNEEYMGINEDGYPLKRSKEISEDKISEEIIEIKKQALVGVNNLTVVTPSLWLADEARKSDIFKSIPIKCIPNGLDPDIFKPQDKIYSKNLFHIPEGKQVILFVADSIDKYRKGFIFLQRAFELLNNKDIILCSIGGHMQAIKNDIQYVPLGVINDEVTMSYAYSAADVFVIPSLMDNLPNTVLESLMCGTPVIGFPVGGIIDMVQHGKNGYITEEISVPSLLKTLHLFLTEVDNFDNQRIRADALSKYDQNIQAEKYLQLFKSILNTEK